MNTLYESLWQDKLPEAPALLCGEHTLSFGELFDWILRAEAGLRALGVRAGDLVTFFSMGTPESIAAFYAVDRIGAVANWVDIKASPAEIPDYLNLSGSKVVLVLELAFKKVFANRGETPAETMVVLPMAPYLSPELADKLHLGHFAPKPGCMTWEELIKAEPSQIPPERSRWEEPVAITYTGGTTGPAKGVMLSRRAFQVSLEQYKIAETEQGKGSTALTLLPPFAAFGLCQCIHIPLCLGMAVILHPLFLPHEMGKLLLRYHPEQVNATSSYWQLLLEDEGMQNADLSYLKNARNGGDALTPEMEKRINAFLAQRGSSARLIKEYGMSEVCGIICLNWGEYRDIGSVGHPLAGCSVVAVDPDTGRLLPFGVQGEILIKSPTVMQGYLLRATETHEVLRPGPDGELWIWTKDMGYIRPDGSVVITGRKKRMISRNGFKIFPSEIENCILTCDFVRNCAVVAGKVRGEVRPVAHIVLAPGTDPEEAEASLKALLKEKTNAYTLPGAYRFRESIPLTERGKVHYRQLEEESLL